MTYMPIVKSANRITAGPLGPDHVAILFDHVVAEGLVEYAFLVAVFDKAAGQPVLFVASEVNTMAGQLGGPSHFLGLFPGDGHVNMGASDDWGDPAKFFPHAIDLAAKHLGVTLPPPPPPGATLVDDARPD